MLDLYTRGYIEDIDVVLWGWLQDVELKLQPVSYILDVLTIEHLLAIEMGSKWEWG